MNKASPLEAVGFGFRLFFKNFFFFLGVFFVGLFTWLASFIASLIITIPFLFPLFKMSSKFFSTVGSFLEGSSSKIFAAKIQDLIQYIFSAGPWVAISLILGFILILIINKMVYDYLMFGLINISVEVYDMGSSSIRSLFSRPSKFFRYFFSTILYNVITWFGAIFSMAIGGFLGYFAVFAVKSSHVPIYKIGIMFVVAIAIFLPFLYWLIKFWFYSYFIADKNKGAIEALKDSYNIRGGFWPVIFMWLLFFAIFAILGAVFDYIPYIGWVLGLLLNFSGWFAGALAGAFLYRRLTLVKG